MRNDNCTHPPFIAVVEGSSASHDQLEYLAERLADSPTLPLVSDIDVLINPIECSWCRKPYTMTKRWWQR